MRRACGGRRVAGIEATWPRARPVDFTGRRRLMNDDVCTIDEASASIVLHVHLSGGEQPAAIPAVLDA